MLIYIILAIITLLLVVVFLYIVNYNKFQVAIIKISEAEENINILLDKKFELLVRISKFLENKKEKNKLSGIEKLDKNDLNTFDLNTELDKYNKKLIEITDYDKEVVFDDKEKKVLDELSSVNIDCLAAEKYYNDNVTIYNKLIKCFPSNIVSKICKYKLKDFYSNEKEEIFEILKK